LNVGYCRVSTSDQSLDLQIDALTKAGCEKIFKDVASGARDDRPGLRSALEFVRSGDRITVYKIDRLGRSLPHLIATVNQLHERGVHFRSLTEAIESETAAGRLVLGIFSSLADFERTLIRERVVAGLAAARARGRVGGRPRALNEANASVARAVLRDPKASVSDLARTLGVSRATIYRCADANRNNENDLSDCPTVAT
jgi:DNA invertase Pin-like site-specific DNA recombinase